MQNKKSLLSDVATTVLRGIVVDNKDPQNLGRVKVRVPSIHGTSTDPAGLADEYCPWASPGILLGAGNDLGQFIVPVVGTRVFVTFEAGNESSPIYLGGIPCKIGNPKTYNANGDTLGGAISITTDDIPKEVASSSSTSGIVYKSLKGSTIRFDDTDEKELLELIDASGQYIKMSSNTKVTSRREDKLGKDVQSNEKSAIVINHNDESKLELTNNNIKVTKKASIVELTDDKIKLSKDASTVQLSGNDIKLNIGNSNINMTSSSITISVGSATISITDGSVAISAASITTNGVAQPQPECTCT